MSIETVRAIAMQHYLNTHADIDNAKDRFEHVRLTTLANEAASVVHAIDALTVPENISLPDLPTHY